MDTENGAETARPKMRRIELIFQWFAIVILMVVLGFSVQFWSYGGPSSSSDLGEWLGRAIGMTIGFSGIPMYVAAWTHMKRPWLVFFVWLPIAALVSAGAVSIHDSRISSQQTSAIAKQREQSVPAVSDRPAPASAQIAAAALEETAAAASRWKTDADYFVQNHAALKYGTNLQLMQEHLSTLGGSGLDNMAMLQTAYSASVNDRRWRNGP